MPKLNKYLVWDIDDNFKRMMEPHCEQGWQEAESPEQAALNYTMQWAENSSLVEDQQLDYLVWVIPAAVGKHILTAYPEDQMEDAAKEVALCFRGYKTWNVEPFIEEDEDDEENDTDK